MSLLLKRAGNEALKHRRCLCPGSHALWVKLTAATLEYSSVTSPYHSLDYTAFRGLKCLYGKPSDGLKGEKYAGTTKESA